MKFGYVFLFLVCGYLIWYIIPTYLNKLCQVFRKFKHRNDNNIYLTFDDGPSEFTSELLDLLKKYNVHATFFIVVSFAENHEELVRRMQSEGHKIGFHSYKHDNGLLMLPWDETRDFRESITGLKKLGLNTIYFRPPWGHINIAMIHLVKKCQLRLIMWDVMAEDWEGYTTSDIIYDKIIKRVKKGNIICLHDGRGKNDAPERTIMALKKAIPELLQKGFVFKTIDEYERKDI
jgi:peptidoglycan/xylan/chitin deacetylase (PgdA/CDA1 family)